MVFSFFSKKAVRVDPGTGAVAELDPVWGNIFESDSEEKDENEAISEVLKKIPIFEGLSRRELGGLTRILYQRSYQAGEKVFHQSDPGLGMYIIVHGTVAIMGEPLLEPLAELHDGDFFGELALLDELPRSATALAKTPASILGFFRPELFGLIERHPRLGVKIVLRLAKIIGRRLRATDEQTKHFMRNSVQNKSDPKKHSEQP